MEKVFAPWNIGQVISLVERQKDETKHPYTCPICSGDLKPHVYGWCCKEHGLIKRSWAHKEDFEDRI